MSYPERTQVWCLFKLCYLICLHSIFNIAVFLGIMLNTAVLSLDRHPIGETEQYILETINLYLTWFFCFEMIIKMIGLGLKAYFQDRFNVFDCLIVILSLVEMVLTTVQGGSGGGAMSTFRGFRLLRVFKLARSWKSFQVMLIQIGETIKDIRNFFVLLMLVIFTYSLLGMELFSYSALREDGSSYRVTFDTFFPAVMTIFTVLIGDDWNILMYRYIRNTDTPIIATLYFVSLIIVGNLILLNLFIAILLKNFEEKEVEEEDNKEDDKEAQKYQKMMGTVFSRVKGVFGASGPPDTSRSEI